MHARMLFTASKHFCALSTNVLALWTERGLYRDCHQGMTKGFVYMCDGGERHSLAHDTLTQSSVMCRVFLLPCGVIPAAQRLRICFHHKRDIM